MSIFKKKNSGFLSAIKTIKELSKFTNEQIAQINEETGATSPESLIPYEEVVAALKTSLNRLSAAEKVKFEESKPPKVIYEKVSKRRGRKAKEDDDDD